MPMNTLTTQMSEFMTVKQAAEYLHTSRRTIYKNIRQGKLSASRSGRTYRIPRYDLVMLEWEIKTGTRIRLREYTSEEIDEFMREDQLDEETAQIAAEFMARHEKTSRE
jgi:excisionase family DNA binding protein